MQFTNSGQLRKIFDLQAFARWQIASTTAHERISKLKKFRHALVESKEDFYNAIWSDFRKSKFEAWTTEIFPAIEEFDYAIENLKSWMKERTGDSVNFLPTTSSYSKFEPKGQVLIMAPWNYPLLLCISPMISAIAAGNVIIAKPSHKTPHVSAYIASLVESVFDKSEVAIIEGDGASVGEELLQLPFDHIFFTGSPQVGAHVGEMSQKIHAGLTLELGGKSPVIVLDDVNIKDAAAKITWGKFLNAGQTCIAPDYLLCPKAVVAPLAKEIITNIQAMFGKTEEDRRNSYNLPRIIDAKAAKRLQDLIIDAVEKGASIAIGGKNDVADRYVSPTVLKDVSDQMDIMQSEIFGPILPIITYENLNQAIKIVQNRPKPLALYIFGKSPKAIKEIISRTTAGSTCINNTIIQIENLSMPFGGVGNSGIGNYHGFYGFKTFSHERNIMQQHSFNAVKFFYPPYGVSKIQDFIKTVLSFVKRM